MRVFEYKTDQNHPAIKAYVAALKRGYKNQHVVPKNGHWAVKRAGATRPSGIYETQKEAITQASLIAQNQGTSVFIHDKDGRVQERLH
jgi:uncharacterized protein YdaT